MTAVWKLITAILLISVIVADANRARRRRQTVLNSGQRPVVNPQTDARQQLLPSNQQGQLSYQQQPQQQPQLLQQQQQQQQQFGQTGMGALKDANLGQNQAGRQYYSGYSNQYGSQGGNYYPYGGSQYGSGQYPQYGQGMGSYGSYYNQYPGSNSFYSNNMRPGSGYNSGYNNNYYPGSGTYGGFWNAGQKQTVHVFTVFLSSFLALAVCLITV